MFRNSPYYSRFLWFVQLLYDDPAAKKKLAKQVQTNFAMLNNLIMYVGTRVQEF